MCGRLVNLDTVARVLAEYYHLKTDTQLAALDEALSRAPAETVGNELFGNSEQLNDTISRAAVVDAIEGVDWYHQNQHGEMVHGANPDEHQAWYKAEDIYKAVESVPSAQQERKKGKWIYNSPVTMKCDQCGFVIKDWDWHRFKFCPNCGADMRGEQDE